MELLRDDIKIGAGIFKLYRKSNGTYKSVCSYMPEISSRNLSQKNLKPVIVAEFESKTKPGEYHYVTFFPSTGELKCSCFGFRQPNKCWHYWEVMKQHEL